MPAPRQSARMATIRRTGPKGRGALSNPDNRYAATRREAIDDGWLCELEPDPRTELSLDHSRRVISWNESPDLPFDRSLNPYRGCEHGCIYCYARPSHAQLGLSPGLEFETRLVYKPDTAARLREELARPGYRCAAIALGAVTDAYQPIERRLGITRQVLEVLRETHHPVSVVTKSALIERDVDLLADMAAQGLAEVALSITTLNDSLARRLEPRAAAPQRRLQVMARLADAGVPVSVMVAPVIPVLTDPELEAILQAAHAHGARSAQYILLRLPQEVAGLFREWLAAHFPNRAQHVMSRLRDSRSGRDNDGRFGVRFTGEGPYAELIAQRFRLAVKRLGFAGRPGLRADLFRPPALDGQLNLF